MTNKQHLLQLLKNRSDDVGGMKDRILAEIDFYTEEQIVQLIEIVERSNQRRVRIKKGEGAMVLEEIKTEVAQEKGQATSAKLKQVQANELASQSEDRQAAEAALGELSD